MPRPVAAAPDGPYRGLHGRRTAAHHQTHAAKVTQTREQRLEQGALCAALRRATTKCSPRSLAYGKYSSSAASGLPPAWRPGHSRLPRGRCLAQTPRPGSQLRLAGIRRGHPPVQQIEQVRQQCGQAGGDIA